MPIDPSFLTAGPEWQIGGVGGGAGAPAAPGGPSGTGFGAMLGDQLSQLEQLQDGAAGASRSLADGTATDPTAAVVAVERAQLAMQLASQLRTKGVEALQDVFHTQV
ncbi:MAG TPA: flagellar hook-basal body complex protein FliE [Baekduia sp.]|nr:flagellar hook-basal body complex protein FliE [Baekduia sp.]